MMNDLRKVAQEQSTDTKSAIGGTRMREAAPPAGASGNRVSTTRIVGGVAVAYAASVIVQNAMFMGGVAQLLGLGDGTGAPTYGDPLGEVLAYHAAHRGRRARRRGVGGPEPAPAPAVRHGTARARAAPWRRRGGLVAARGGSRSDALGALLPRHSHAHRGRARRGWPGRADPRLRAGLAAPCRGLRARAARARGDLHRRGVGHPRQRFDAAVAAAARRGGGELAHFWRGRKTLP